MSISVRGTLIVQRKHGRRGDFSVGELNTEIGEFEVKDPLIEEYEPGSYAGDFVIKWIQPDSFAWRGKVFVKNRAMLEAIFIDEAVEGPVPPPVPPEVDPIDAAAPLQQPGQPPHQQQGHEATRAAASLPADVSPQGAGAEPAQGRQVAEVVVSAAPSPVTVDTDPDAVLFGAELFALLGRSDAIKLDPTVDRESFRRQRDRLKALGYGFDPKAQAWYLREAETA